MLMKICNKCGKKLPHNERCTCQNSRHKLYNSSRRDKTKNAFYHSREWTAVVAAVKARAQGLDEYALARGLIEFGSTVHHIYPIDDRPDLKLALDNLIYVSAKNHNHIHAAYSKDVATKKNLQAELTAIIAPAK